jgi:hypothetical protein
MQVAARMYIFVEGVEGPVGQHGLDESLVFGV